MKKILLLSCVLLSACSLFPVRQDFPVAPKSLQVACPELKTVDEDTLKGMLKVVIQNYMTYYQCSLRTEGWQEWYTEQKRIYDAKK